MLRKFSSWVSHPHLEICHLYTLPTAIFQCNLLEYRNKFVGPVAVAEFAHSSTHSAVCLKEK